MSSRRPWLLVLPIVLLFLIPTCFSQTAAQEAPETTIRSKSNVVLVPVLVKNLDGSIEYGLQGKDFVVEDDGIQQSVHLDEQPEGQPISLVIAIQCGRSASHEFPRIARLNSMLEPIIEAGHAEVSVLEFDSKVHQIHGFTDNPQRVAQDLQQLQPGDGGAAILDAVDESVKLLENAEPERRRVLLLVSETRDHGSTTKIEDVVAAIGKANTVMYALAFSPALSNILDTARGNNKSEMHEGIDVMDLMYRTVQAFRKNVPSTIASMTGGEYELFATQKKFEVHMNDFTNHLGSRYLLSFAPKSPHPGLHQLRVRLRGDRSGTVLARSSYWAQSE